MKKILLVVVACCLLVGCGNKPKGLDEKLESQDEIEESIKKDNENSDNKDLKSDEVSLNVVEEYFYMRDEDNARYFLVLKNDSDFDVSADVSVIAKDSVGNPLGVENGIANAVSSGQEVLMEFYFDEAENVGGFEYSISAEESEFSKSEYKNLSYDTFVNGSKLIVTITNNGKETAENVSPHAIFFNNGEIFSHEYSGYEEIEPGQTKSIELDCFEGEFEDFKLYIEAWSSK